MEYVVETENLTRYFGKKPVVDSLNLRIPKGSIYGFLGRNGAGKSTTIKMLLGFMQPTRGSATVFGEDSTRLSPMTRGRIGYLGEGHYVYGWMTVNELRDYQRGTYGKWNDDLFFGVIDHFGLSLKDKAKNISRGQRAGLCLALTLAPEPELLVLDDPALGLDPVARHSLLQAMVFVTRNGDQTILFSSHMMADVERVVDRIAVLDHGVLLAECSLDTFRQSVRQFVLSFKGSPPELETLPGLLQQVRTDHELIVTLANPAPETIARLHALAPGSLIETSLGLEDAFINYLSEPGTSSFLTGDKSSLEA
jgi:ABC-2 type transport system ATP-binding protein